MYRASHSLLQNQNWRNNGCVNPAKVRAKKKLKAVEVASSARRYLGRLPAQQFGEIVSEKISSRS
jgi:hypothetical protein